MYVLPVEIWWVHCNWERSNKCVLFGPIYSAFSGKGWALGISCHCLVCTALSWNSSALLQSPARHPKVLCQGNWCGIGEVGFCARASQLCCLSAGAVTWPEQLGSAGQPLVAQHSRSSWIFIAISSPYAGCSFPEWDPAGPAWSLQQQEFELISKPWGCVPNSGISLRAVCETLPTHWAHCTLLSALIANE